MKTPLRTLVDLVPGNIVFDGEPALPPAEGTQQPPPFGPCLLWPQSPISATAELLLKWNKWIDFCMCTLVKNFRISVQGVFHDLETAKMGTVEGGCFWAGYSSNGTISGDGNHFGGYATSQGCAFCTWVLSGEVLFGRYKSMKKNRFWQSLAVDYTVCWRPAPRHNYFCQCLLGYTAVAIAESLFLFKITVCNSV